MVTMQVSYNLYKTAKTDQQNQIRTLTIGYITAKHSSYAKTRAYTERATRACVIL